MKIDSLINFFSGNKSPQDFVLEIDTEVDRYKFKYKERGTSLKVILDCVDQQFVIGSEEIVNLCNGYLDGHLSQWHVYYICDAIQMYEGFIIKTEDINKAIDLMTDPEVNGEIDRGIIQQIKIKIG